MNDSKSSNSLTLDTYGSHMPLDTEAHWTWPNSLNILLALVLIAFVIGLSAFV